MNDIELKIGQVWAASFPCDDYCKKTGYRITDVVIAPGIVEDGAGCYFTVSEIKGGAKVTCWTGRGVVNGKVYLPDNWTLIEDAVK